MTAVEERPAPQIGQARKRKEDRRLITGSTTWTDNMTVPGMLHLAFLRSPMAHAKITAIDPSEATKRPGVVAFIVVAGSWTAVTGVPTPPSSGESFLVRQH